MKKSRLLVTGSVLSLTLLGALPARAQEIEQAESTEVTVQEDQPGEEEVSDQPILVTGTRIARPTLQ